MDGFEFRNGRKSAAPAAPVALSLFTLNSEQMCSEKETDRKNGVFSNEKIAARITAKFQIQVKFYVCASTCVNRIEAEIKLKIEKKAPVQCSMCTLWHKHTLKTLKQTPTNTDSVSNESYLLYSISNGSSSSNRQSCIAIVKSAR